MLSTARRNGTEVDVEALLCTLLDRIRRSDRGAGTQWSHVHVLYKAFTDCVRIIAIALPDNILLALFQAIQGHLQSVDGEEEEDEYDGRLAMVKRTVEMIKDALHAVAEVAGIVERPQDEELLAHRSAKVYVEDLGRVDPVRLGGEAVAQSWVGVLQRVAEAQAAF